MCNHKIIQTHKELREHSLLQEQCLDESRFQRHLMDQLTGLTTNQLGSVQVGFILSAHWLSWLGCVIHIAWCERHKLYLYSRLCIHSLWEKYVSCLVWTQHDLPLFVISASCGLHTHFVCCEAHWKHSLNIHAEQKCFDSVYRRTNYLCLLLFRLVLLSVSEPCMRLFIK